MVPQFVNYKINNQKLTTERGVKGELKSKVGKESQLELASLRVHIARRLLGIVE